jgi:hypothetical protein
MCSLANNFFITSYTRRSRRFISTVCFTRDEFSINFNGYFEGILFRGCLCDCRCGSELWFCKKHCVTRLFVPIDSPPSPCFGYGLDTLNHRLYLLRYTPGHSLPMKLIASLPRFVDLWSRFVILRLVNMHGASGNGQQHWQWLDITIVADCICHFLLSSVTNWCWRLLY